MTTPSRTNVAGLFGLLALADIIGIAANLPFLHYIAKPLLMPLLAIWLWQNNAAKGRYLIIAGLIFSWLGDCFLLFEKSNGLFFIFGLVSFLITHILYIAWFLSKRSTQPSLLKKQPLLAIAVPVYGIVLVWLLLPGLGQLTIPVIVYATTICSMLLCSLHIFYKVNVPANKLLVAGASLFVISDSILAVNKFYQPIPLGGVWIMLTYCAAQYCIVKGAREQHW